MKLTWHVWSIYTSVTYIRCFVMDGFCVLFWQHLVCEWTQKKLADISSISLVNFGHRLIDNKRHYFEDHCCFKCFLVNKCCEKSACIRDLHRGWKNMKRRNAETGKLRRPLKRTKITEGMYGKWVDTVYIVHFTRAHSYKYHETYNSVIKLT